MARQARKMSPTDYYHVMMRGNNRESILAAEWQKAYFTGLLHDVENIEIVAYCLMDNHVHIVAKGKLTDLSDAIKKINIKYAMRFNRSADRIGHVFQDRYRSEEILDDAHLLQVIRYVHNNPVKAGMIKDPERYPWSSFREYIKGTSYIASPAQMDLVMAFFAGNSKLFRQFHLGEDRGEFLDIREDVAHNRAQAAQAIIEGFCRVKGITDSKEISERAAYLEELIAELLQETKLSHRQIAKLLAISNSAVHKASLETPQLRPRGGERLSKQKEPSLTIRVEEHQTSREQET